MILRESDGNPVALLPTGDFGEHLRLANGFLDDGSENQILATYLRNAMAAIERFIGQALLKRRFELKVGSWNRNGHVTLPIGPVESIVSFRLLAGNSSIPIGSDDLELQPGPCRQRLSGRGGAALPSIPPGYWAEIVFDAGHAASWTTIPSDLSQAVMLLAAHFYEFRGGAGARSGNGLPEEITTLLERHRPVRL